MVILSHFAKMKVLAKLVIIKLCNLPPPPRVEFVSIIDIDYSLNINLYSKDSKTIHPFPPLLNPKTLDYKTIPNTLAYHLNLPLPQNYNFIYFSNGSSASAANLYYFKISNTKTNPFWLGDFQKYKKDYDLLLNNKQDYIFLTFHPLSVKDMFLLDKKVDMYYIARDPIEKLQHGINHTENDLIDKEIQKNPLSKRFNLTCDYNKLFVSPIYRLGAKTPQIHVLHDKWIYTNYVAFSSYLKIWQNLGIIDNVYCVDFKDFSKEKAFDTFSKVAKYFHFEPPKDEKIFNDRINRNRGVLINLPTTLYAHPNDISNMFDSTNNKENLESLNLDSGVSIHIGTYQDFITNAEFIDISSEFFTEKLIIDKTQILIFMLKAEFDILSKNNDLLNACKKYIKGYINALQNRIKETQSHLISEDSIIEYLRDHKDLREKIRNIMDIELSYFKENHAEMMQGWEYYQKFEIMCKQEDSKSLQKSNQSTQSKISKNIIESKTITPPPR